MNMRDYRLLMEQASSKIGVMIVQLGTPDSSRVADVRKYLKEFLSDPHVVEVNRFLWSIILNGIILRTRPQRSALLYDRLFRRYGPLLKVYTKSLTEKLEKRLPQYRFYHAMRYGNPSLEATLCQAICEDRCDKLLILPLFPQYSNSTTGSVIDRVNEILMRYRDKPEVVWIRDYYNHPQYQEALACHISQHLTKLNWTPDAMILSYHGIPVRYVKKGDPYQKHCEETSQHLQKNINVDSKTKWIHAYQSRFGKEPWLQPYLDETLEQLAREGVKKIVITSPAFSIDCLETVDELGVEMAHLFRESVPDKAGVEFYLIPALNDADLWVERLSLVIEEKLKVLRT